MQRGDVRRRCSRFSLRDPVLSSARREWNKIRSRKKRSVIFFWVSVCRIIREEAATIGKLSGLPGSSNVIPWGIFPFIVLPGRKKSVQIISGCIASSSEMTLFPGVGSGFFSYFLSWKDSSAQYKSGNFPVFNGCACSFSCRPSPFSVF